MQIITDLIKELKKPVSIIVLITVVSSIAIYLAYQLFCKYVRGQKIGTPEKQGRKKGKKAAVFAAGIEIEGSTAEEQKKGQTLFLVILAAGFIIRLIGAASYRGYEVDINCFLSWSDLIFQNGIGNFYGLDAFTDYPPGYMYVLYVIGGIRSLFGIASSSMLSVVLTKLPAIFCDLAISYLVYKIAKKKIKETGAAILAGIFLITPAVILDGAVWAQVDSVFTLCIVLMCYLVTEKKLIPSYFAFAVGILIKPQSLIFTPVLIYGIVDQIFIESYRQDEKSVFVKKFWTNLGCGILAILMIGLFMLPFGFMDAFAQYSETMGSYPYASVNAYNFWTLIGRNWSSQTEKLFGLTYQAWGMFSIVATVLFSAVIHFKSKDCHSKYYFTAALIVTSVFTLSVRMHERYVYPALALLLLSYAARPRKKLYLAYIFLALGSFCNMAHVMIYYDPQNFDRMEAFPIYTGGIIVALLIYLVYLAVTEYAGYVSDSEESMKIARDALPEEKEERAVIQTSEHFSKLTKNDWICMAVITLVYAVIAFTNLGNKAAPTTGYSAVEKGAIVLDFGEEVNIGEIWNFLGYQNNPKYVISYTSNPDMGWTEAFSSEQPWDAGSVFCWNQTSMNITGRYVWIAANTGVAQDSLLELVFTDTNGNMLLPANASDYRNLFDEQAVFPGRRNYKNSTYFDEIYHARTAYEMIHHLYCYENTHPPLGKAFIALGVLIFGMNPFGWRFMGALFGVLMLPVLYLFAKRLFKETWISAVTTILFAFDFMHYAQTRIATIDVFVTLFIIITYYFMNCYTRKSFYDTSLKDTFIPLGLCGITMGISWACKWTGIYASAGLCIIFFLTMIQRYREYRYAMKNPGGETSGISHQYIIETFRKKFLYTIGFCIIFFLVVPAVIYTLSYLPMSDGTDRGLIQRMLENQKNMFNYHSKLESEHPYSSTWYEWPMMKRPIFFYSGETSDGLVEGISSFGNPLVWWVGIPAFVMVLYYAIKKGDKKSRFLTFGYLSQYLPWVLIGRVVFIYHYFPSVPFVALMIGYCMKRIVEIKPKWKNAMYVYAALAVVVFVMFYPVLTGTPVRGEYVDKYLRWFSSWVLTL